MKKSRLFSALFLAFVTTISVAHPDISGFQSPKDIIEGTNSNINLRNNSSVDATVYGLYIRQYAYVTPGNSCNAATLIYTGNVTGGSFVTPVTINAGKSAALGSNFLYNMIMQAIYYENIIIPSSPPGCALPGCTWGTDSTHYNWCIHLGALAPVANSSSYTASIPPSTDTASGAGYQYNLISSYADIGPISCNDQTLTCSVATQQNQAFS